MSTVSGITNSISSLTNGTAAADAARLQQETTRFQALLNSVSSDKTTSLTSNQIAESGRLNGDYISSFSGTFTAESDKTSRPVGAAANSGSTNKTIDRTSELYEKSLELESYFVKMMLSSMRSTLSGTSLNGEEKSYAQSMYEDMLYDELAVTMTKNAGFGLADQIYLDLI